MRSSDWISDVCSSDLGMMETRRMRVAMLAPISWRTPPRHYGPWELVTSLLTEALVARGVDVTLFATLDSQTAGILCGVCSVHLSDYPAIVSQCLEIVTVSLLFDQAAALALTI